MVEILFTNWEKWALCKAGCTVICWYILSTDENDQNVGFYWADDAVVPTNRAYLTSSAATLAGVRLNMVFADESTGVKVIDASQQSADGYYNLNGWRVERPSKGLYILNGKKVFVK